MAIVFRNRSGANITSRFYTAPVVDSEASPSTFGNALQFDGVNDLFSFSTIAFTGQFTVSFWVKYNVVDGVARGLISNGLDGGSRDNLIYRTSDYILAIGGSNLMFVTDLPRSTGTWYHIVLRRNGSNLIEMFQDNTKSTITTTRATQFDFSNIGRGSGGAIADAVFDEVSCWNTALSDADIGNLYNSGNGALATEFSAINLQAYWRMNESGTDTTAVDSSGNGNDGTLTNFPASGMWVAHVVDSEAKLLDTYGSAAAAYSVRRLSSTYTGSLIEVRRSSDNTTQNIGYDANGDLDTAALLTFVGAGNGFVRTWYDQSGNSNNLQQTTTSIQPQIATSGVVELLNSKPTLKSFGGSYLQTSSNPVSDGYISVFSLNKNNATAAANPIVDLAKNISFGASTGVRMDRNNQYRWGTDGSFIITTTDTVRRLFTGVRGVTNRYFYSNGALIGSNAVAGTQSFLGVSSLVVGAYYNGTLSTDQYFQETIIYNSDETANRAAIETDINTYYSIYP